MRVTCKCGNKGKIRDSRKASPDFVTLYCYCLDVHCGHTWVAHLTFSHTLSPSAQAVDRLLFDRLKEMPRAQQREMFEQLGAQITA
ncbi:ogr/Delta-like zinc finger family protein [Pseudomonas sp. DSV-1]|uniref:ogr/Delta-like zinc finger family protein n=1 Tax=Pseudomonas sp. DSV-1 TaxID=3112250 RepID=UPI002DB7091F|nr:ogr/Delta-like zinc finger family protein [Pseudomonas sp. DSV-1]MEC4239240.1 ogr/Delta-like zinc finger family protein [Pseudomonas sp. DSV-1]